MDEMDPSSSSAPSLTSRLLPGAVGPQKFPLSPSLLLSLLSIPTGDSCLETDSFFEFLIILS